MKDKRNSNRHWLAMWAIAGLVSLTGVQAAPPNAELPDRSMIPAGDPPLIEASRTAPTKTTPGVPSKSVPRDHSLEAGIVIGLEDVPAGEPDRRGSAPRVHRQGDADVGIAQPPQRPSKTTHPPSLDDDLRAVGRVMQLFDGIDVNTSTQRPPDTNIAVGPQYVVEVVNSGFTVFSKMGDTTRAYRTFNNLLANSFPADWVGYTFDPRIVFDATYQKFVMLVLGKDVSNEESGYWVAVSETSDPRGNWCVRGRDATDSDAGAPTWIDFAGLGTDAFGVYVTGNYLYFSDDTLRGAAVHSFAPEMMTSCGPVGGDVMHAIEWPSGGALANSIQPAQAHSQNADGETFFVTTRPTFGTTVMLSRLAGNRANNPSFDSQEIAVPEYGAIGNNVDQPGSTVDLDGGSAKPLSAVYVDGRVLFSLGTAVAQTAEASGWLTVELDTATNSRVWDHIYWLGEGRFVTYPALTFAGDVRDGNIAVFGSMTDNETLITPTTDYASGLVRLYDNHPNDTGGTGLETAVGTSDYVWLDPNVRNRWGDYSGAAYDWTCGHAWGATQFASGPTSWKTKLSAIEFDDEGGCPQIYVTAPAWNQEVPSGSVITITWQGENLPSDDELFVFYDTDDTLPVQIGAALSVNQASRTWTVPELPSDTARIIVGSYDGSDYSALHYSDPFTIVDATPPTPNPEWVNPPTATGPDSIAMSSTTVTDGSGGPVQYNFLWSGNPDGGAGGADSGWKATPAYQDDMLQPNYEYCYVAYARDQALNTTFFAELTCVHTHANAPTLGSFSDITNTSITVQANENGNAPDTEYRFENVTTGLNSQWIDEPLWVDFGLLPDRSYVYRVRARNSDGIETTWTTLGAAATTNDDADGDGILAAMDNCLLVANADQRDTDGDNIGNVCDFDLSQDCVVNVIDLGILRQRFFSNDDDADFNGDGVVNVIDLGLLRTGFFGVPGPSGRLNVCSGPS